jgi:hypothetical protein
VEIKLKICDGCDKPRRIWKNKGGLKFCQQCWSAQTSRPIPSGKQKKISPRSSKRVKEESEYSKERRKFLLERPMCEAHLPGCTHVSTDVHHKMGRIGKLLLNVMYWLSCCRSCHNWIELNPSKARELGFSLSRLNKHD